ncbi:MAG: alpha/beta family hydrolase [Candidatus Thorarchaeota archaeon]|jgi:predicted alpha/beta-hydrolase family hydrolase
MFSSQSLNIIGYGNALVPNSLYTHEKDSHELAIIFPGYGYSSDMPLLYYSILSLLDKGVNVLSVDYNYSKNERYKTLSREEREKWLYSDVDAVLNTVKIEKNHDIIALIGKSLGTMAIGHLLDRDPTLSSCKVVWLTPLLKHPKLPNQIVTNGPASLIVIGTADQHYDAEVLSSIQASIQCDIIVIKDANHSMEISGNTWDSIKALNKIVAGFQEFFM